ncbi:FAD/NAD(P)-binding protein [Streptomyces sp. Rer75]|uniref:FAD/NAD(P)-binding protein n=1 Tax=Streptomyces sp. Rer75 TaxID=2750011 RepID=UPI0015D053F9|nr:FAD/NAD(P)-binding protein [Streptomyces sp. Rer75]QLH25283.1 FAD/NAD(P)-binding protein [Streptomyces sp. Rer75]
MVGGGASATAFLCALAKQVSAEPVAETPDVLVFEPAGPCGPGVAYREDTELALLNRPVPAMSVDYADRGHFRRWVGQKGLMPARGGQDGGQFVPRAWFGRYLAEMFDGAVSDLRHLGSSVEIVHERVSDVRPAGERVAVLTGHSAPRWVDDVVLCLGAVPPRDVYGLFGSPGYIHQPYPVRRLADDIGDGAEVLVLGSGLTAIDVALELSHKAGPPRVTLASRSGTLPDVRCDLGAGDCAPGLVDDVREELARRSSLGIADLARLLDGELSRRGTTLRDALRPFLARTGGAEQLRARLGEPGPAAAVQRCVVALTPWYSRLWRAMDPLSGREFTRRYGRIFTSLRSPMPPANARRLLELSESGALAFRAGIAGVTAEAARFRASFGDGDVRRFDVVVNATGRGIDITAARPGSLVDALGSSGVARPHPLGGLDVDPESNEVLDASGARIPRLHVVGDLSSGVHFHTSSMEYAATQAQRVAEQVAARLHMRDGVLL